MASFCTNCGTQLSDNAKFCVGCGQAAAQHPIPVEAVHQEQPVRQHQQYFQQQSQYQQPYAAPAAPKKKKGKLKIILPIVGAVLIGIALLVIFVILPGAMNTMAKRDFYNIATNDVPTVKYILGEKRTVTGVSATTRSDGFQEQVITYKAENGEKPKQDMLTYATAICDEHGFYAINDNDFSGVTGKGFQFAKESNMEGNLVIVQIDYDMGGYVVTLLHGKGTLKIPETSAGGTTDGPWVGLWRYEGNDGVALYHFHADGSFLISVSYTDGTGDELTTGKYSVSEGGLTLTEVIYNDTEVDDEFLYTFEGGGDMGIVNGLSCERVPDKDAVAVLADPLAPYTPDTTEPPATTQPSDTTNPPVTAEPQKPTVSFTGTWRLSDSWGGEMVLTQTGDKVTGTYGKPGGKLEGTVSGNVLTATWTQSNNSSGTMQLTMSGDGKSFGLKWEYETDPSKVDWPKDKESERGVLVSSEAPSGSLTADVFALFESGTYRMVMSAEYEGASTETEVYTKGDQTAMVVESEGVLIRIVMKDEKSYTIMDDLKTIMVYPAPMEEETSGAEDTSSLTFVRQGAEDFHGNTYAYDEYTDGSGGRYLYFMDGGRLKGIRTVIDGLTSDVQILAFDADVPDDVFDIPTDYEVQDMTGG